MAERSHPTARIRISPVDLRGRSIDPEVLAVANEISERALSYAEGIIGDPALATSLLEESAATVSRVVGSQSRNQNFKIRNLEAYLFRAFLRRITRARRNELPRPGLSPDEMNVTFGHEPFREIEQTLLVHELLRSFDTIARNIFYLRIEGFSWKEIGRTYSISAHSAESRVRRALNRLRKKLGYDG